MINILLVKKTMMAQGWNQVKLAEESGLHNGTVSRVLITGRANPSTIQSIAKVLNLQLDDLLIQKEV